MWGVVDVYGRCTKIKSELLSGKLDVLTVYCSTMRGRIKGADSTVNAIFHMLWLGTLELE